MTNSTSFEGYEVNVEPVLAIQIASRSSNDPAEISKAMSAAFGTLQEFADRKGIRVAGPPRAIYTGYSPEGMDFVVAVPVATAPEASALEGPVTVGELPGGRALRFEHRGPYQALANTYNAITGWMMETGRMESEMDWDRYMPMWEEYLTDPESTPEEELLTHIFLPVA